MSSPINDFLDKFFDLCWEYQQEIPPEKMAEVLREYADRLDGWMLADLRNYCGIRIPSKIYTKFLKVE